MDTQTSLVATVAFTSSLWMFYVLNRFFRLGVGGTLANPRPDRPALSPWAQRAKAAHANAVEGLVVFAPLVLVLMHLGLGNSRLATVAAMTYFGARVAHFVLYVAGVPGLRTVAFLVGYGAQLALVMAIFQGGSK